MKKIWVLGGGPSTEFEVSLKSARVVCEHISLAGQRVRPVVITRSGRWIIPERDLSEGDERAWATSFFEETAYAPAGVGDSIGQALAKILGEGVDCLFLALHGQFGEDGSVQGFFETAQLPYTGSGVLASALAFCKPQALRLFETGGIAVPKGRVARRGESCEDLKELRFPLFVKPVRGGSSVGMSLVHEPSQLEAALEAAFATDTEALVEERVVGTEVTCGVLDLVRDGKVESIALPPTELRPVHSEYFDFAAKYTAGETEEITPPELPEEMIRRVQECALQAHRLLGCEGVSRTDMIITPTEPERLVVLETNTIPGMTQTSLIPQQAAACGIGFPEFLNGLVEHAMYRAVQKGMQTAI